MNYGYLTRADDQCFIVNASRTNNFIERMFGLLGTSKLEIDQGLLISPCSSVHTFGMRYAIDLIFLDKNWTIVKTVKSLKPWRMATSNRANMVLELAADMLEKKQVSIGQKLEWHDKNE